MVSADDSSRGRLGEIPGQAVKLVVRIAVNF
jgi:hypothetical protein